MIFYAATARVLTKNRPVPGSISDLPGVYLADLPISMRNLLTLLLLLSLLPVSAQELFVPVGATWSYNGHHWEDHGVMLWLPYVDQIACTGTEVVDGRLCSALFPTDDPLGPMIWCNYIPPYLNLENDTVYYWNSLDSTFQVLYVLNASIGDSWTSPSPAYAQTDEFDVTWTVLDTGHIEVGGTVLRQWVVQSDQGVPDTLTERMGLSTSLTPWNWGTWSGCDLALLESLRCYADDEVSWMAPGYAECVPSVGPPTSPAIPFDMTGNSWYVANTFPAGNAQDPSFVATRTTRYFYNGSTTVGDVEWKDLYAGPTWSDTEPATLQGHVHQSGPIVLFMDTLGGIDTLYNFSLQVGDSVHYPEIGLESPYLTIEAIDTVMIQDQPHRRFRFSQDWSIMEAYYSDVWIEGIGSRSGPLAPRMPEDLSTGSSGWPDSTRTTCFLAWDNVLWQQPGYNGCTTNILMGMDGAQTPEVLVYPNPANDAVHVDGLPAGRWTYRILDVMGRNRGQGDVTGAGGRLRVDVTGIPAGPYLLRLEGPGSLSFRVIKE